MEGNRECSILGVLNSTLQTNKTCTIGMYGAMLVLFSLCASAFGMCFYYYPLTLDGPRVPTAAFFSVIILSFIFTRDKSSSCSWMLALGSSTPASME